EQELRQRRLPVFGPGSEVAEIDRCRNLERCMYVRVYGAIEGHRSPCSKAAQLVENGAAGKTQVKVELGQLVALQVSASIVPDLRDRHRSIDVIEGQQSAGIFEFPG